MEKKKIDFTYLIYKQFCVLHGGEVMPYEGNEDKVRAWMAMIQSAQIEFLSRGNKKVKERLKKIQRQNSVNHGLLLSKFRYVQRQRYPYSRCFSNE